MKNGGAAPILIFVTYVAIIGGVFTVPQGRGLWFWFYAFMKTRVNTLCAERCICSHAHFLGPYVVERPRGKIFCGHGASAKRPTREGLSTYAEVT